MAQTYAHLYLSQVTKMKYFIILCICSLLLISVQSKEVYKLIIHRAEVTMYVKEFGEGRLWITKPSRFTNALNGEFILHNIPHGIKIKIKMHEFLNNEYRPFAINFERDLCSFLAIEYKVIFYPDLLKIRAHMPEPRCPIMPGNYSFANLIPDVGNFPPALPFHNFMFEIGYWLDMKELAVLKVYGALDRDAVIREQYG